MHGRLSQNSEETRNALLPFDFVVLKNGRVASRSIRFETRIWICGNELSIHATSGVRCCIRISAHEATSWP